MRKREESHLHSCVLIWVRKRLGNWIKILYRSAYALSRLHSWLWWVHLRIASRIENSVCRNMTESNLRINCSNWRGMNYHNSLTKKVNGRTKRRLSLRAIKLIPNVKRNNLLIHWKGGRTSVRLRTRITKQLWANT